MYVHANFQDTTIYNKKITREEADHFHMLILQHIYSRTTIVAGTEFVVLAEWQSSHWHINVACCCRTCWSLKWKQIHNVLLIYSKVSSYVLVINILNSLNRLSAPKEISTNLEFSTCDTRPTPLLQPRSSEVNKRASIHNIIGLLLRRTCVTHQKLVLKACLNCLITHLKKKKVRTCMRGPNLKPGYCTVT